MIERPPTPADARAAPAGGGSPLDSLRAKFAALVVALGVAVALNAAVTFWGLGSVQRQYDQPMRATERAMLLLGEAKRAIGAQHNRLAGGARAAIGPAGPGDAGRSVPDAVAIDGYGEKASAAVADLRAARDLDIVLAPSVPRYLEQRLGLARVALADWRRSGSESDRTLVLDLLFELHERIELIERRVIENAARASAHAGRMRDRVLLSVWASVTIAILGGLLAIQLVRRWILSPVQRLRDAAVRFAAGELDHRVHVRGRDEVATLAAEFNAMAATIDAMQAERIERERLAAFGAVTRRIVHNIKSPLGGIRMLAELTAEDATDRQTRDAMGRIVGTVDRFNIWLKRLLDVTRPAEVQPAPVACARWLADAADALRPQADGARVELVVDTGGAPGEARFDAAHLEQALVALLANAIEATPAGGRVTVRAWQDRAASMWGFDVADQGPGVPSDVAGELFQPYFTTKPGGSGIGLAMVRKVARDHGGDAWLRDPGQGAGAVFAVSLPLGSSTPQASTGRPEASYGHHPAR